jgi:hypothetical protein
MLKIALAAILFVAPIAAQGQDHSAGGCGPSNVNFDVKTSKNKPVAPSPPAGKALVYVIETMWEEPGLQIDGLKVTTRVGVDGAWVGAIHGDSYFFFPVDPGEHSVCTDWQSSIFTRSRLASAADLTADAGQVYYFRTKVRDETKDRPGEVKIEPIDEAEAKLLISSSTFSTSHAKK